MSCFNAITDNNKYTLPCDKIYNCYQTSIELFPGYNTQCCCYQDYDVDLCKSKPVAVIKNPLNVKKYKKCCGR